MRERAFETGKFVMTKAVNEKTLSDSDFYCFVLTSLCRHITGDWGDMDEEDKALNQEALKGGGRLHSSYCFEPDGEKIWIITEADRSVTTVLFPSDY